MVGLGALRQRDPRGGGFLAIGVLAWCHEQPTALHGAGDGEDGVEAPQHGAEHEHLSNARVHRHPHLHARRNNLSAPAMRRGSQTADALRACADFMLWRAGGDNG
jgi:hypothetical protein